MIKCILFYLSQPQFGNDITSINSLFYSKQHKNFGCFTFYRDKKLCGPTPDFFTLRLKGVTPLLGLRIGTLLKSTIGITQHLISRADLVHEYDASFSSCGN